MTPPTLRTQRLLLEPYLPTDEDDFVALFQDERVGRWMGDGLAPEAEDRAVFGRVFTRVYPQGLFDVWAVRHQGRYAGHAEVKRTDQADGHEIIYALSPDVWGAGLGTELADRLADFAFHRLELDEVHATVAAGNEASLRVLGRVGFRHVRDIPEDGGTTTHLLTRPRPA